MQPAMNSVFPSKDALKHLVDATLESYVEESHTASLPIDQATESRKWQALLSNFQQYGLYSFGNRVTIYDDGDACYKEMYRQIDNAKERVWLEVYIFDYSTVAETMISRLCDAARRGCDVIVLLDWIGSLSIPSRWINQLRSEKATVVLFNSFFSDTSVGPLSLRDHRKILITDNVGFCGSMNVNSESGGPLLGKDHFYDIHVKVEGPATAHLAEVFRDSLIVSKAPVSHLPYMEPPPPFPDGSYCQILESNVLLNKRSIQAVFRAVLAQATHSIHLTSSYFLPPGFLRRALVAAARNGIPISLLISGNSDIFGDVMATTHIVKKLLTRGRTNLRVYSMQDRHCHAKCLVVDGLWASLGSFNWDRYSSRRNLEVTFTVFDRKNALAFQRLHTEKVQSPSVQEVLLPELQRQNIFFKISCALAYSIVRLLGKNVVDGLSNYRRKPFLRRVAMHNYLTENIAVNFASAMVWGL